MDIAVFNQQTDVPLDPHSVKISVALVLMQMQVQPDEVSVYFVSEQEISNLHKEFFDDPTSTDCISLPIDSEKMGGYQHLGEIFVCPKTALKYLETDLIQDSVYQEITLYVIHALLHLLGYDDLTPEDANLMVAKQTELLEILKARSALITAP